MYEQSFPPELFINRELSWLEFNARVLEEAEDQRTPLLERVKFLSIFSSNLDEFFMVRVAGLREQAFGDGAPQDYSPDGLRAIAQLQRIAKRTQELVAAQYRCWNESVRPALAEEGIRLLGVNELTSEHQAVLDRFFRERAFPILTPMAIDPAIPARAITIAGCIWRRCWSGGAAWARSNCSPSCKCRKCCRGWCRWEEATSRSSFCWKMWSRRGCRSCSAASTCIRGPRSASRATATSSCWSKNRTTCCG